jgi:hypothetical protein
LATSIKGDHPVLLAGDRDRGNVEFSGGSDRRP